MVKKNKSSSTRDSDGFYMLEKTDSPTEDYHISKRKKNTKPKKKKHSKKVENACILFYPDSACFPYAVIFQKDYCANIKIKRECSDSDIKQTHAMVKKSGGKYTEHKIKTLFSNHNSNSSALTNLYMDHPQQLENDLAELNKMLVSFGTSEDRQSQMMILFSGILAGYFFRKLYHKLEVLYYEDTIKFVYAPRIAFPHATVATDFMERLMNSMIVPFIDSSADLCCSAPAMLPEQRNQMRIIDSA